MEFIPLERYSEKSKEKKFVRKRNAEKNNKLEEDETDEQVVVKKVKPKPQRRVLQKKNVKNKYREVLTLKNKKRVPRKNYPKNEKMEEQEEIDTDESNFGEDEVEEEEKNEEEQDYEKDSEEEAFKEKCRKMDEKKKNRLFVKLKKKITSEAQIKELHPDIRSVIFPRKKNSRWCWAVFASEERADEAFKQLVKNKDIFVSKPNPYEKVHKKMKAKLQTVLRKKEVKKKLQEMWM